MKYAYTDLVVFRTPRYPEQYIHRALDDKDFFKSVVSSEEFKRAIYFASPTLSAEHEKYLAGTLPPKQVARLEGSLLKYLARMSTRCTPFATLASCATASVGDHDDMAIAHEIDCNLRPDMLYLCSLSQSLLCNNEIRRRARYKVNSTLYHIGNKLRYIAYRYTPDGRTYSIEQVANSRLLNFTLKQCHSYIGFEELAARITGDYDIPHDDAAKYIDTLIDNQLIISELDPTITGEDYFTHLRQLVGLHGSDDDIAAIGSMAAALQQANSGNNLQQLALCYNEMAAALGKYGIKSNKKFLIQVDSFRRQQQYTISDTLMAQLGEYMAFLDKITPRTENSSIADFRRRFTERYDSQEVGLLEALDPDSGIGYVIKDDRVPNPLIAGLRLPQRHRSAIQITLTPLTAILLKKLADYNPATSDTIVLTNKDVKGLDASIGDLPLSMAAFFRVIGKNDDGSYRLADLHFTGMSAANMLGRFAYADSSIKTIVDTIARQEQAAKPNAIIAEIAHISESRTGNILARPHLRDYEITYLTNSTLDNEHVIPVSDLTVSVQGTRVVLRSRRLQKEVIPRLTTAHNYRYNTTPVYRFLCDLQTQAVRPSLYFSWGGLENALDYLPRVVYKNCILSPAKWVLPKEDFMTRPIPDIEKVRQWRNSKKLPREVNIVMGDNKLYIDMESETSIALMLREVAKLNRFTLEEYIPCTGITTDCQGNNYNNEFIVPYVKIP